MKRAFLQLHISILLAGFTGIFGRLITLSEGLLVWYRMVIASALLFVILKASGKFIRLPLKDSIKIALIGFLLSLHWIFFYGSIKAANVSVGVICFSLTGFFTAIFNPLLTRKRFSWREILFSIVAVTGILLIFHFDARYRAGIAIGVVSAALAALFMIANKSVSAGYPLITLIFYEIAGGLIPMTFLMPLYLRYFNITEYLPDARNLILLFLFVIFCTIIMYMLQISALRQISAFTVNLSYNLEPIYTIVLAGFIFEEHKYLNGVFYIGFALIVLSVLLQMRSITWKSG